MVSVVSLLASIVISTLLSSHSSQAQRVSPSRTPSCWGDANDVKNSDTTKQIVPLLSPHLAAAKVSRRVVTLRLCIDGTGRVARSIVLVSSGNKAVDQFYRDAVGKRKYRPAESAGKAVPSAVDVSIGWNTQ